MGRGPDRDVSQPVTFAIVTLVASLIGYSIGVGSWSGKIDQMLIEHERRLNSQDRHMENIDEVAANTSSRLASIEVQLGYLVRSVQAAERAPYRPSEVLP